MFDPALHANADSSDCIFMYVCMCTCVHKYLAELGYTLNPPPKPQTTTNENSGRTHRSCSSESLQTPPLRRGLRVRHWWPSVSTIASQGKCRRNRPVGSYIEPTSNQSDLSHLAPNLSVLLISAPTLYAWSEYRRSFCSGERF